MEGAVYRDGEIYTNRILLKVGIYGDSISHGGGHLSFSTYMAMKQIMGQVINNQITEFL